jgi:CDP-glycerol glycerophosphotransferase (TagB/SpsB family)
MFNKIHHLIPRNKRIWVFGSRLGYRYDENSKYLFEYVNRNVPDIRAIWLTRSQKVFDHLKRNGREVYIMNSLAGYFYSSVAGAAIISICLHDVNNEAISGAQIINLWHGTPLKKTDIFGMGEKYDLVILSAEEFLHNNLLGDNTKSHFVLTGYPRNDILLSSIKVESIEQLKVRYQCEKIVLYLPTYRDALLPDGNTTYIKEFNLFESFGFKSGRLEDLMRQYKALFVIKLHPANVLQNTNLIKRIHKSHYLYLVDPDDPLQDVYEYMKYADVLITDYSSVCYDFLLLNRPIIFAPFDFDNYIRQRPLGLPYEEVTPGPKAKKWDELCAILEEVLAGRDDWAQWREIINRRFNAYRDDKNSERVCKKIKSFLEIE